MLPTISFSSAASMPTPDLYVPLNGFTVTTRTNGHAVTLSWPRRQPVGTRASYAIFRRPASAALCNVSPGTRECAFKWLPIASVDTGAGQQTPFVTSFTDHPHAGAWTYLVAMSATPDGPQLASDFTLMSHPLQVTVRGQ
jgi:hypothetical protein